MSSSHADNLVQQINDNPFAAQQWEFQGKFTVCVRPLELVDVHRAVFVESSRFAQATGEQTFRRFITEPETVVVGVFVADNLVGLAAAHIVQADASGCTEAYLDNISILEEWSGKGLGTLLFTYLLNVCQGQMCQRATLEVRVSNRHAIRIYKKLGFVSHGLRPKYYANPVEDAEIYWLENMDSTHFSELIVACAMAGLRRFTSMLGVEDGGT